MSDRNKKNIENKAQFISAETELGLWLAKLIPTEVWTEFDKSVGSTESGQNKSFIFGNKATPKV